MTTVVVVDDHPAVVAGVPAWCAAVEPPIEVLACGARPSVAWTGPGAAARVVLFDLHLTGLPRAARLVDAGRQVVVYTSRDDRESALTCLEIGAAGYLTKGEGPAHLVAAVRAAAEALPYTSPSMARAIQDGLVSLDDL